ncbi:hypothetical protein ARAM_000572 [Aspergillus rambellii]|uniref:Uncharacterized protein n=1 Tax=Aspergillus rambellii TaxID=308745 RepID=A0A0F8WPP2_9EURO|nr:hypothetical protein ARAM_000572 [Aspergillus rambellii]
MVHRQSQDLEIVDRLMEPQTAVHFLEFCFSGILPNGKETALEKLNPDDMQYLHASPEGDEDGRPISERVMSRVGSVEDSDRLCLVVGKNIQSMKNRTCEGIIPLSEQRWKEKGLDQEDHFDIACQSLSAVVAAWEYLNQPRVAKNMRDTFHLLWGHWEELEVMINRQRMIDQEPPVSVTRLWLQFIVAHFQVVAERAHRWVIVHVNALRAPLLQRLAAHRPMNLDVVDSLQWKLTDRLHMLVEIASVADYAIMIPMHGYNGYTPPPIPPHILPALRSASWEERRQAYSPRMKLVTRATRQRTCTILPFRGESDGRTYHRAGMPMRTGTCSPCCSRRQARAGWRSVLDERWSRNLALAMGGHKLVGGSSRARIVCNIGETF